MISFHLTRRRTERIRAQDELPENIGGALVGDRVIRLPKQTMAAECARTDSRPSPSALHRLSDEELIARHVKGDDLAFSLLFRRYHRLVLNIALKILRDPGEAEDLLQETFLEIYQKTYQYDLNKGSAKIWILQYAYHRSLNRREYLALRRAGSEQQVTAFETLTNYSRNGRDGLMYEELARLVRQGLATLTPKQREVMELAFFEGLLLTEIADRKKESLGNVRNYYYRALKKLRALLHNGCGQSRNQNPQTERTMSRD